MTYSIPKAYKKYIGFIYFVLIYSISGCVKNGPEAYEGEIPFDESRKKIADQVISCFENDDPTINYGYAEILNDGRGITAGRAGFTTGTGDLLLIVQKYSEQLPNNPLEIYLPLLTEYAEQESNSTIGLEQLPAQWLICANDSLFRAIQDQVSDKLYYQPALNYAIENGITYPLTLLCLYDACIQHGDGEDPDGLSAMIEKTNKNCGGSPANGIKEYKWLHEFNQVRKNTLKHPDNKDSEEE